MLAAEFVGTEEVGHPAELPVFLQGGGQRLWECGLAVLLQTVHLQAEPSTH